VQKCTGVINVCVREHEFEQKLVLYLLVFRLFVVAEVGLWALAVLLLPNEEEIRY
jgi:hypothetical protein